MLTTDLRARIEAWRAADPDIGTATALGHLLAKADEGDTGPTSPTAPK